MKNKVSKILTLPLRLAIINLIIGALFKIMHWPYAQLLMAVSGFALISLYTFRFLYKKEKTRLDYIKFGLVIIWVFSYFNQVFHLLNLPYYFEIIGLILFIWWFIKDGLSGLTKRKFKEGKFIKSFYYTLITITIFCLVFGILFKVQHWPYGALLFTLGIVFLCLILIVDYFVVVRT